MEHAIPFPAGAPLADIRDVSVNQNLPKEERIAEFLRQIKNPYCFRCGKFTVRAQFAENAHIRMHRLGPAAEPMP